MERSAEGINGVKGQMSEKLLTCEISLLLPLVIMLGHFLHHFYCQQPKILCVHALYHFRVTQLIETIWKPASPSTLLYDTHRYVTNSQCLGMRLKPLTSMAATVLLINHFSE